MLRPGLLVALVLTLSGVVQAQTLSLDASYGSDDVTGFNLRVPDLHVRANGQTLVVRGTGFPPASALAVYGLDSSGRLDPEFGTNGGLTLPLPPRTDPNVYVATARLLEGENGATRIVATAQGALLTGRLMADGTLDTAYAPEGLLRATVAPLFDMADARADGARTVVLSRAYLDRSRCAVTALTPEGGPDPLFGTDGTAFVPSARGCVPVALALTPEGPVALVRLREDANPPRGTAALVAFTLTGDLRTSFGDGGTVVLPFEPDTFTPGSVLGWSGRLVVGGTDGADIVLVALTRTGAPDPLFGPRPFRIAPALGAPQPGVLGLDKAGDGSLVFTTTVEQGSVMGPAAGVVSAAGAFVSQPTADGLFSRQFSWFDNRLYAYRGSRSTVDASGDVVIAGTMTLSGSSFEGARVSRLLVRRTTAADAPGASGTPTLRVAPNPAAGSARVTVALDAAADARVTVLDALGRTVAVLHDGPLSAGETTIRLDAAQLPSGVYAAVVQAGALRRTTRVTVVR